MNAVGIIDIGSNTVRCSVVECHADGAYRVRHEQKAGLRLGARIGPDGRLGPQAAEETGRVVAEFAAAGADWGVGTWIAVGTAAVRQAADGTEFLQTVSARTGIEVRQLDGESEARLGVVGALNTLAEDEGYAVDIGGASTEVTRFAGRRSKENVSLPLGTVNATARFGLGDRASPDSLGGLRRALDGLAAAARADTWLRTRPGGVLVGIGGTVRALCKLDRKRRGYALQATHNYLLDPGEAVDLAERLATLSARERLRLPGMAEDRADLIAAGSALLAWVVRRVEPVRIVVSGNGLREGLFYSHLLRDQPEPFFADVLAASATNLERLQGLPEARGDRLARLAAVLWEHLAPLVDAPPAAARLVPVAARLREAGTAISYYDWERHSFYVLREARLYGLDHRERLLLAAAAAYESPGRLREEIAPYTSLLRPSDERLAVRMGLTVALTHALDRGCLGKTLPVRVEPLPSAVRLTVPRAPADGLAAGDLAEDFRKWFGRALGVVAADAPG